MNNVLVPGRSLIFGIDLLLKRFYSTLFILWTSLLCDQAYTSGLVVGFRQDLGQPLTFDEFSRLDFHLIFLYFSYPSTPLPFSVSLHQNVFDYYHWDKRCDFGL